MVEVQVIRPKHQCCPEGEKTKQVKRLRSDFELLGDKVRMYWSTHPTFCKRRWCKFLEGFLNTSEQGHFFLFFLSISRLQVCLNAIELISEWDRTVCGSTCREGIHKHVPRPHGRDADTGERDSRVQWPCRNRYFTAQWAGRFWRLGHRRARQHAQSHPHPRWLRLVPQFGLCCLRRTQLGPGFTAYPYHMPWDDQKRTDNGWHDSLTVLLHGGTALQYTPSLKVSPSSVLQRLVGDIHLSDLHVILSDDGYTVSWPAGTLVCFTGDRYHSISATAQGHSLENWAEGKVSDDNTQDLHINDSYLPGRVRVVLIVPNWPGV